MDGAIVHAVGHRSAVSAIDNTARRGYELAWAVSSYRRRTCCAGTQSRRRSAHGVVYQDSAREAFTNLSAEDRRAGGHGDRQ